MNISWLQLRINNSPLKNIDPAFAENTSFFFQFTGTWALKAKCKWSVHKPLEQKKLVTYGPVDFLFVSCRSFVKSFIFLFSACKSFVQFLISAFSVQKIRIISSYKLLVPEHCFLIQGWALYCWNWGWGCLYDPSHFVSPV